MRVERIDEYRWRVPREGGMRTEGLIFADAELMRDLEGDQSVQQVANVAHLPGIVGPAIAMPDIHWGYGFPIGGVAAFDEEEGVVSPGGVGYDINCGVRLLVAPLGIADVRPRLAQLVDTLFATIPSGVGASRSDVKLGRRDLERVLSQGARWAVEQGYGVRASRRNARRSAARASSAPWAAAITSWKSVTWRRRSTPPWPSGSDSSPAGSPTSSTRARAAWVTRCAMTPSTA